jgi:hypothetical protein
VFREERRDGPGHNVWVMHLQRVIQPVEADGGESSSDHSS